MMTGLTESLPTDADARRAITDDLDDTLVVEAAAGTGKTTELINRILSVLASGRATMTEIVAVTFTEKAAGGLKLRLREEVERARGPTAKPQGGAPPAEAPQKVEKRPVNTIHGFFAPLPLQQPG